MRWHCLVTRSVPLPALVTTPVYFVTVELLPAPALWEKKGGYGDKLRNAT